MAPAPASRLRRHWRLRAGSCLVAHSEMPPEPRPRPPSRTPAPARVSPRAERRDHKDRHGRHFRGAKAPCWKGRARPRRGFGRHAQGMHFTHGSQGRRLGVSVVSWSMDGALRRSVFAERLGDTPRRPRPFRDEDAPAEMLGPQGPSSLLVWNARLDPSGLAAVLFGSVVSLEASSTKPHAPSRSSWRDPSGGALPEPISVARPWLDLVIFSKQRPAQPEHTGRSASVRVDNAAPAARAISPGCITFPEAAPVLTRRAGSSGLGLLVLGAPTQARSSRDWYVIPIDPENGALSWPERLLANDLEGRPRAGAKRPTTGGSGVDAPVMPLSPVLFPSHGSRSLPNLRLGSNFASACRRARRARKPFPHESTD